ncbi:hypothetical protein GCM10007320_64430 [Pseudorhodoferax aquiterrae]|uniref:Adhesin HecA-like repeat protein n=1 Tax=Pseudorhodoferax aquiterrae TaxID=747304 RepID=A0ABQ3GHN9_9BURK|nr:hypothetical protein GCM10007320_64430 [Pseudorhodoferax aquiterrae]
MANVAQATFVGGDIVIECDDRWGCCQRAQAKAKVQSMNREIARGPKRVQGVLSAVTTAQKDRIQGRAKRKFDAIPSDSARAADARARGAPDCLADEIEKGASRADLNIQMDHPLDVKLGGLASAKLTPLDGAVNLAMGLFAKNVGNDMGAGTQVTGVSLICPGNGNCPGEDHSVGTRTSFPSGGQRRTANASSLDTFSY